MSNEELENYITYMMDYKDDQKIIDYLNGLYKASNLTKEEYWKYPYTIKYTKVALLLAKLKGNLKDSAHYETKRKEIWDNYQIKLQ